MLVQDYRSDPEGPGLDHLFNGRRGGEGKKGGGGAISCHNKPAQGPRIQYILNI